MFHSITGVPFESGTHNGEFDGLTMWEQMDEGAHFTPSKKFLAALPIVVYYRSPHWIPGKRQLIPHKQTGSC